MRPRLRVPRPHHRARTAAPAAAAAPEALAAAGSPLEGTPRGLLRLSEAARVATRIDRAKKAKKRVRTRYRTTKRLAVRSLPAGKRKITLGRLKRGRLRIVLTARDTAGNRGSLTRAFRVN